MIDLPVATRQPYPSKNPWYDVSQYLAGGLTPYADQSVIACADGNFVHYSFHIRIDRTIADPDYIYLSDRMHPSFRVAANTKGVGWFRSGEIDHSHSVEFAPYGWVAATGLRAQGLSLADYSMAFLNLTAARSKP